MYTHFPDIVFLVNKHTFNSRIINIIEKGIQTFILFSRI